MMTMHKATILLDSVNKYGNRLTTFELTFPRIILAEWNTHRMFTRSSASSRAIPVAKMIKMVQENPYVPSTWGKNQKGMTAAEEILGSDAIACEENWLRARDSMVDHAEKLMKIGVHKQLANRLLEPFMWHTIINTATEYSNFFGLRDDKNAHPDIQLIAHAMRELYEAHTPTLRKEGEWHAPYAKDSEDLGEQMREVTSGRCARVSYLTHDGERDVEADIALHDKLLQSGHMSPLEHAARPMSEFEYHDQFCMPKWYWDPDLKIFRQEMVGGELQFTHFCGNLNGWVSYRKEIRYEDDYATYLKSLQNK